MARFEASVPTAQPTPATWALCQLPLRGPHRCLLAEQRLRPVQPREHKGRRAKDRQEQRERDGAPGHLLRRSREPQLLL
jgi:hypothetical protein